MSIADFASTALGFMRLGKPFAGLRQATYEPDLAVQLISADKPAV